MSSHARHFVSSSAPRDTTSARALRILAGFVPALVLLVSAAAPVHAQFNFEASWQPPSYEAVREQVLQWLDEADLNDEKADQIRDQWPADEPAADVATPLLDRVASSFAAAYPDAAELVERCSIAYTGPAAPDARWLAGPEVPPFVRDNLRLFYARWLAQFQLYDEVLDQIDGLRAAEVVDPASLLFYQMVARHQLVQPDEARAALAQLMEHEDALPRRYQQIARLVERDLSALKDESLDHIARRMRDIRRRLGYGRAGPKVQEVEQGVLDSLDKKIEDLEKQQQQQAAAAQSGGSSRSASPMQDSMPAELKAPMKVDQRDIGNQSGWGELPPKEREQALQQIGREYPAHYRELIEEYFRELANEEAPDAPSDNSDSK